MKIMMKINNSKSMLKVEVSTKNIENIINLLWEKGVHIQKLKYESFNTVTFVIFLKDYNVFIKCVKKTNSKFKIINRKGVFFSFIKYRYRKAFVVGVFIFLAALALMKSYIWKINIETEQNVAPYEIRQFLSHNNIKAGIKKKDINIVQIEDMLTRQNDEIVWAKVRIYGTTLKVEVSEKQNPPEIKKEEFPSDLVAKRDGEIVRVYTKSGTAVVESKDIVKKGDVLVKGIQGQEGSQYLVNSDGKVIARTFYEKIKSFNKVKKSRKRTGEKKTQIYFQVLGKKIFIKNQLNNYNNYDKIIEEDSFMKKITFYEVEEKEEKISNVSEFAKKVHKKIYDDITVNFDRGVKVVETIKDFKEEGDKIIVRLLVIAEEDIAEEVKSENNNLDDSE